MSPVNTIRRRSAHYAIGTVAAVLAALFISRICGNGIEPVESKELPTPRPVVRAQTAPRQHNFIMLSECPLADNSESFNYTEEVHKTMLGKMTDHKFKSEVLVSGRSADETKSEYQNPKHDHYDVVEIKETKDRDYMTVELTIWSYWTDDAPNPHPHPTLTNIRFDPCNWKSRGWDDCRTMRVNQIQEQLVGLDNLHK